MTLQVKIDKNRCIKNAKTHNCGKIAGEEKCMNETQDVKERQRTGERLVLLLFLRHGGSTATTSYFNISTSQQHTVS